MYFNQFFVNSLFFANPLHVHIKEKFIYFSIIKILSDIVQQFYIHPFGASMTFNRKRCGDTFEQQMFSI